MVVHDRMIEKLRTVKKKEQIINDVGVRTFQTDLDIL